jgi:hypothetical protein
VRVGGERITRAKGVRSDEARLDLRCPAKDPPTKVSLLEVFVWFPTSEIMVLSQQALQVGTRVMALDSQSEVGFLSR